jgi:chromosomal replication initiation ATPase DnaA
MRIRDIQQFMAERGYTIEHTTIMYGLKRVSALVKNDKDYKVLIKELKNHVIQPEGGL